MEELERRGVEVISVTWPEHRNKNKLYRYDPNGEKVEAGDIVLVPSKDQLTQKEFEREAEVALGNHKVEPESIVHPLNPYIDTVLTGEGEESIVTRIKAYENGESPRILCGAPFADFANTDIPYDENEIRQGNILYYESARGCPYRCAYCLSGAEEFKTVRAKSQEKTLDDLRRFEAFDNVKIVKFIDRTFNYDIKRANAIWQAISGEEFTKQYHFEIAASLLNEDSFAILQAMPKGKIQLEIGVQSTNPDVLKAINRPDHTERVLNAIKRLYTFGNIHIHTDLIVGLPRDTYHSIGKSYDALAFSCHDLQLGFLKLLKGSPLYLRQKEYGYRFHCEPPYEVLSSDTLSFAEIAKLKKMETVHERYMNSHRFTRAMQVLCDGRSPFGLLEALSDFLPDVTTLSQRDAYVKLLEFDRALGDTSRRAALVDAIASNLTLTLSGASLVDKNYASSKRKATLNSA